MEIAGAISRNVITESFALSIQAAFPVPLEGAALAVPLVAGRVRLGARIVTPRQRPDLTSAFSLRAAGVSGDQATQTEQGRGELDGITLLKNDHRAVEGLFKRFEQAGDRAHKTKRKLVDQVIKELSVHAAIEEQVFYPATREYVESAKDDVLESLEEHHIVKWTLSELEGMDPKDERFEAKVTVLMESVRHHVKEEEQDMFPKVRKAMSRSALADLGEQMQRAKATAPTRPHPRTPDEPPGNVVVGTVAAAVDAGRDLVRGVADAVS